MSDERFKMPPTRDFGFYQCRKHDKWRAVDAPAPPLEALVADTHAHLHMLPDPLWELERARANNVTLVGSMADPSDVVVEEVRELLDAARVMEGIDVVLCTGVHPHNAAAFTPQVEQRLADMLAHPAARVVGEIGLDYYYDLSPRDAQRDVFRRQLQLARELNLPVALHLRNSADPTTGNAHAEALDILLADGLPPAGVLLHCCSLAPDELQPWVEAGCYVAYGGALTFKKNDAARAGARLVPRDRLLLETDAPFMTPEPMRGAICTPAHVIFTAALLAETLGAAPGAERKQLLEQLFENSWRFFRGAQTTSK